MAAPCVQSTTCNEAYSSLTVSLPTAMIAAMNAAVTANPGIASVDKLVESAFNYVGNRVCPAIKTKS